jgi:predicted dehydrogenase
MTHTVGIIMNGVTGRMGLNQHLARSIYAIIQQGGVKISDDEIIMPKPLLLGRNKAKLEAISRDYGHLRWSTDLDAALSDPEYSIYFDAQTTDRRADAVRKAVAAGKHIYCEKPIADTFDVAYELYQLASKSGVKHGVVQDKLGLPGMLK